jgi:hypothetical protein
MIFVSGCETTPRNNCSWVSKFEWSYDDADKISIELIKQIKTHNELYEKFCKP